MSKRIYLVSSETTNTLVRATNQAQAIRHVAIHQYSAKVASQDDLVKLVAAGQTVEDASADGEES